MKTPAPLSMCLDERFPNVTRSYIIASTMRTGSHLLCEGLYATGVAGNPIEAFCPDLHEEYCLLLKLPIDVDFATFFCEVIRNGTTDNGVFGVKIHQDHIAYLDQDQILADDPDQALRIRFPKAQYIHLRRLDLRAQAISFYRALTSNEWWRISDVANPRDVEKSVYDGGRIIALEKILRQQNEAWERFFALENIEPLAMDYETLSGDYRNEVGRALAFIGEDSALAADIPDPRLIRQADSTTDEWRKRLDLEFPPG
jgi:LPS sulfotransferase NodH